MKTAECSSSPVARFWFLIVALVAIGLTLAAASSQAAWENESWATIYSPLELTPTIQTAPDGAGGLLVAEYDAGQTVLTLSVTRLDRTGNEVWGNEGTNIPFDVGSDGMLGPLDVVDDGALGAYCAYTRVYGGSSYIYLSHLNAAGVVDLSVPVGDYGPNPKPAMNLEKANNGDLLVVWTRSSGTMDQELIVTRLNSSGTQIWETTAWADANNSLDQLSWFACSDQFDGVLLGIGYQSFSGYYEHHVQRVDGNGSVLWGPYGTQVLGNLGNVSDVLPDAAGGVYLMKSMGWGENWAQHINAAGAPTWTAGGILLSTVDTWPNPTTPVFCIDGGGGFYAVDGVTDLNAQHVDINGSLLWGADGLPITSLAGFQKEPSVAYDGFGGLLVSYEDDYYSELTDLRTRAISAVRLDAFGTKIWEQTGFWWSTVTEFNESYVTTPQTIADGSGGALVIWNLYDNASTTCNILASGLGPDGSNPALPTVAYIFPDAGQVGDVQQALVLGDYLDLSQTFSLVQPGATSLVLTGVSAINPQLVTGTLDLTTAQMGPYDLEISSDGTTLATLPNAYGVGQMVPCTDDEPITDSMGGQPQGSGNQRRMAFDSEGKVHSCWVEYGPGSFYHLYEDVVEADGSEVVTPLYESSNVLRDVSFAIDADDVLHYVVVEETGGGTRLVCLQDDPVGGTSWTTQIIAGGMANPAIAVDTAGVVHIVYEGNTSGPSALYHVIVGPGGPGTAQNLNAGNNAVNPDLIADGSGLMLTFVRDLWFPGWREVCYQQFDGAVWAAPVGMYFGVYVKSPSVAFDGVDKLLFSWVLDNTGSAPLLHTMLMTDHVAGTVRWRTGLPSIFACSVAASGPGCFQLMTMEEDGAGPVNILLREGNGEVFYPRRRLNSTGDVDSPYFCARYGLPGVAAMWAEYDDPTAPLYRFLCFEGNPVSGVETPLAVNGVRAYPNPFNPSTTFSYSQRSAGWVKLVIYNLAGERVRTLVDGFGATGPHNVSWDGRDTGGRVLPSGVYFSRLQRPGGQREVVTKVTMLK